MKAHLARRVASASLLVFALFGIGGTAVAVWAAGGTGTGSGDTGTALAVTIDPGTSSGQLYPGGTADVKLKIDNTNDFDVTVASLSLDTTVDPDGFAVDGGHSSCTLTALGFLQQTNGGAGWVVPANTVDHLLTLTDKLTMTASAVNACQGATFTVYVKAP